MRGYIFSHWLVSAFKTISGAAQNPPAAMCMCADGSNKGTQWSAKIPQAFGSWSTCLRSILKVFRSVVSLNKQRHDASVFTTSFRGPQQLVGGFAEFRAEAIVKKTMRLHPAVPMLVPRFSREDCTISGYDIPTGTLVLVSVWTIGRDPGIWDSPDEFRPERFIGSSIDVKGHDFELLPFGSRRRMCPGYTLGLKVIQTSLADLLHGFSWRFPEGMKKEVLNMEEIFGFTTPRKFPLEVVVEPKPPAHLYGV